jgi:uncharacterized protein
MKEEYLYQKIADELNLKVIQVKNTIELFNQDNTVPFIARYRKEKTGSLNEDQIRAIQEKILYLRALESRKSTILKSIQEQGKLTSELKQKIENSWKLQELEDIYLPFKPKKRTRAKIAKEKGLELLAQIMLAQMITRGDPHESAAKFINPEKGVNNTEDALTGARDILAEIFAENADIRKKIRELTFKEGIIHSGVRPDNADPEFKMYFDYHEAVNRIPPHRILAINRGERKGTLKVNIEVDLEKIYQIISTEYIKNKNSIFYDQLMVAIKDSYNRLIEPAIKREVRSQITEKADEHGILTFTLNLKNLLMQAPVAGKIIMGIDPGYRTGCKIAVIDKTGKYLEGTTIYPHPPQKDYFNAKTILRELIDKYDIDVIAIGNGTASRETELLIAELINEIKPEREVYYVIVNEAGASVYSASQIAKEEFPDLEVEMRGNISIGRRLQDPLAELVKIDPKSIGVGLYQHDVNQKQLAMALNNVIESCVNNVGVDLNTASAFLLKHVSGLTHKTAQNIISCRNKRGAYKNREELKKVEGIGEIVFQQSAGFLRIFSGDNPLDTTSIHPESYQVTKKLLNKFNISDIHQGGKSLKKKIQDEKIAMEQIANEIGCGLPTLIDILNDLEKPGRDPREDMPKPIFRSDVLKIEDLKPGMILTGTVRNVVDFGVFLDIGVKQDGLVHISEMTNKYIKSPHQIVAVGDIIEVKVLVIDLERERIALSMKVKKNEIIST